MNGRLDERVGRLVLASCEAFDNYPPGVPGSAVARAASIPGGLYLAFQSLRLRPLRRLPLTWGWMSKRPVPDEVMDGWFRPLQTQGEIRRDLGKYAMSIPPKKVLLEWSELLRTFDRPALVVWAKEDRVCPQSMEDDWQSCFRRVGWSRSRTATRSSPKTSPENLPTPSESSCEIRDEPVFAKQAGAAVFASLGLTRASRP